MEIIFAGVGFLIGIMTAYYEDDRRIRDAVRFSEPLYKYRTYYLIRVVAEDYPADQWQHTLDSWACTTSLSRSETL